MQSRALRYFLAVYDTGSFSVAAEKVNITQPALSKAIGTLEAQFGVKLFKRRPHGVVPTRYGDILVRHARRMESAYRHALAEIDAAGGGAQSLLRIGAGPLWYSSLLPRVLGPFLAEHPEARVRVQSGVINTLVPALQAGQVDLICTTLDFPPQAGIVREPVIEVNHTVVARQGHPLHDIAGPDTPASAEDIAQFRWTTLADDEVGSGRVHSYFAANGVAPPRFAIETSSPSHMFEMLARTDLLAHIPARMVPLARRFGLDPIPVDGAFWTAEAGICYRQTDIPAPHLERIVTAIRALGTELRAREAQAGPG